MKLLTAIVVTAGAVFATPYGRTQQGQSMKVHLTANGAPVTAVLYDNAAARDLMNLLPLELTLDDYASAE